jgi:hypothetical protein
MFISLAIGRIIVKVINVVIIIQVFCHLQFNQRIGELGNDSEHQFKKSNKLEHQHSSIDLLSIDDLQKNLF